MGTPFGPKGTLLHRALSRTGHSVAGHSVDRELIPKGTWLEGHAVARHSVTASSWELAKPSESENIRILRKVLKVRFWRKYLKILHFQVINEEGHPHPYEQNLRKEGN